MPDEKRIEGQDKNGDTWEVDTEHCKGDAVAIIGAVQRDVGAWAALDQPSAARAGAFLLNAAKVDIVSAARKACAAWREDASIHDVRQAMSTLAAELAKLEGIT
jgi:hypothetical protein